MYLSSVIDAYESDKSLVSAIQNWILNNFYYDFYINNALFCKSYHACVLNNVSNLLNIDADFCYNYEYGYYENDDDLFNDHDIYYANCKTILLAPLITFLCLINSDI